MNFETAMVIALWAAMFVLALALAGVLRQVRILEDRLGNPTVGPTVGSRLPELATSLNETDRQAILFASADCGACDVVVPAFLHMATNSRDMVFRVMYDGVASVESQPGGLVAENQREVFSHLGVHVTPFLLLVDASGLVEASRAVGNVEMLRDALGVGVGNPD